MRLDLGSPVRCSDEAFGELADIVIDPQTRRLTHLVVQPHHRNEEARLVPVDRCQAGDSGDATISLGCTIAEMGQFERIRQSAYLRLAGPSRIPIGRSDRDRSRFPRPRGWTPSTPSTSTRT